MIVMGKYYIWKQLEGKQGKRHPFVYYRISMETETVKLLKALPNMLRKVMPTVVVAT